MNQEFPVVRVFGCLFNEGSVCLQSIYVSLFDYISKNILPKNINYFILSDVISSQNRRENKAIMFYIVSGVPRRRAGAFASGSVCERE